MNPTYVLTHKELLRILDYNPHTRILRWKISNSNKATIGSIAGTKSGEGYIAIIIRGKWHLAHRLAWFYYYGYWPENDIDHRNRKGWCNWILNLREATPQCNSRNRKTPNNNTSGVKGVSYSKQKGKWMAYLYLNGDYKNLGYYKDFDEAVCARLAGEQCVKWAGCDSNSPAYLCVQNNIK